MDSTGISAMKQSYVYAIASEWAVKIGVSVELRHRQSMIQNGNPERLVLVGAVKGSYGLESRVHEYLRKAGHHLRGEWFLSNSRVVQELLSAFRWGGREDVEGIVDRERWKSPLEPTTPLELFLADQDEIRTPF